MDITITVPDNNLDDFKAGFLKAMPKEDGVGNLAHFETCLKRYARNKYKQGKRMLAEEAVNINDNIME